MRLHPPPPSALRNARVRDSPRLAVLAAWLDLIKVPDLLRISSGLPATTIKISKHVQHLKHHDESYPTITLHLPQPPRPASPTPHTHYTHIHTHHTFTVSISQASDARAVHGLPSCRVSQPADPLSAALGVSVCGTDTPPFFWGEPAASPDHDSCELYSRRVRQTLLV